jgi:hypothetical protein
MMIDQLTTEATMILTIDKAEITPSTSLPHHAASIRVNLDHCTCNRNGMCRTCDAWTMAVRYFKANPKMIVVA